MDGPSSAVLKPVSAMTAAEASRRLLGQKRKLTAMLSMNAKSIMAGKANAGAFLKNPQEFVVSEFKANGLDVETTDLAAGMSFLKPTEEMIEAYKMETVAALRKHDVEKLRELHKSGIALQCCNRFGESLIHMACRRGETEIVRFLVQEAKVSLLVRDDYGRTPLHDACWTPKPKFELVEFIVSEAPELLCVKDVRGHAPLNYIRKEDYAVWRDFFVKRRSLLNAKAYKAPSSSASSTATSVPSTPTKTEGPEAKKQKLA